MYFDVVPMIPNNRICSFFSDQPSPYFTPSDTVFVGLCTGLLSASAVASSQSTLSLIVNALTTVRVAFRIGVKVNGVAQRLSRNGDTNVGQSWSRLVVGAQKEASVAAVGQFNEQQVKKQLFSGILSNPMLTSDVGLATSYSSLHKRV